MRNWSQNTKASDYVDYDVARDNVPDAGNFDEAIAWIQTHASVETKKQALQVIATGFWSFAVGEMLQSPKGGVRKAIGLAIEALGLQGSKKGKIKANATDAEKATVAKHELVTKAIAKAQETARTMMPGTGPRRGDGPTISDQRKAVKRAQAGDMTLDELGDFLQINK